jgi:hypothetical protein
MSGPGGVADQAVRWVAFGQLEGGVWGAAWLPPGSAGSGILGLAEAAAAGPIQADGAGPDEPWRVEGGVGGVTLEGAGEPVWSDPEAPEQGFDQLCRVTGEIAPGGAPQKLDCLGWRGAHPLGAPAGTATSFRIAASWFDVEDGFALMALRPRKARGQDEDSIRAVLFDAGTGQVVAEPRLSTTYTESAGASRAGVELWIETEPDSDHLYPRRALGEALAAPTRWTVSELALEAQPFRWFSGGREGPGIYLLGQW